jgi:hypothetical protein
MNVCLNSIFVNKERAKFQFGGLVDFRVSKFTTSMFQTPDLDFKNSYIFSTERLFGVEY